MTQWNPPAGETIEWIVSMTNRTTSLEAATYDCPLPTKGEWRCVPPSNDVSKENGNL